MKITKRQLKRIIKEEKQKLLLKEGRGSIGDMFAAAADALEQRDGEAIERIENDMQDLLIPEDQRQSYVRALRSMAEAAYELQAYEDEGY
jgi:isopentenyl phosphate kinase